MYSWKIFDETSVPPKEDFYSELNLEGISDENYGHAQKVWEVFEITNCGEYHYLYVQTDTLLLADFLKNLETNVLKYMDLGWQACLKKTEVKLELLTDIHMLLMIEEGISG